MATAAGDTYRGLMILAGNSCPLLAADVARKAGVPLCDTKIYKNIERETQVEISDSLRGKDVFIIQTGSLDSEKGSINDSIMELLIMCYACKTSSARSVTGVMPYLPYSKQSKMKKRGCITAKLVAAMLAKAGMSHLITLDLYMKEIQGFFDFPVDNLRASPFLIQYIQENIPDYRNAVIVARYPGVTRRANSFAERLRLALAVIHGEPKEESNVDSRHSPPPDGNRDSFAMPAISGSEELGGTPSRHKANLLSVVPKEKPPLNVVGDVHGKIAIIVDDVVDEVDRIIACAKCLQERGAYKVYVVATHGIFSDSACELLMESPITEILVTNTIPHDKHKLKCSKVKSIDISLLLAEAIRRIYYGESMSYLFRNIPLED